jgi:hypothetical protein
MPMTRRAAAAMERRLSHFRARARLESFGFASFGSFESFASFGSGTFLGTLGGAELIREREEGRSDTGGQHSAGEKENREQEQEWEFGMEIGGGV